MVSFRCIMLVRAELKNLELNYVAVDLGTIEILQEIPFSVREQLKANLLNAGLQLLDDKKSILIERIKNVIIHMIHYSDDLPTVNV